MKTEVRNNLWKIKDTPDVYGVLKSEIERLEHELTRYRSLNDIQQEVINNQRGALAAKDAALDKLVVKRGKNE